MRLLPPPIRVDRSLTLAALAICLFVTLAGSVHAQVLTVESNADTSSYYHYNTNTGVTAAAGAASGSVGTGGTSATSAASFAGGDGNFARTSDATASADFATASLHTSAITDGYYGDASASARLQDTVTFHIDGATAGSLTPLNIDLWLDGTISAFQTAGYLYNFGMTTSGSSAGVGWTTQFYDSPTDPRNYVGWAVSGGLSYPTGFESWELLTDSATEKHFHGVLLVPGSDPTYDLFTSLQLRCSGGTDCDFSHTARLVFGLAPGMSFTSGSGALLTSVAAVPEPETYALLLAGLVAVGSVARRRRAA